MSKGLEEIKTLRGFNQVELNNDKNINKSLDIIEKELKALEIIKDYNWFSFNEKRGFVVFCNDIMDIANEEEFNLLKEVLCDEKN